MHTSLYQAPREVNPLASSAVQLAHVDAREMLSAARPRRLASDDLLAGDTEVLIEHGESVYRLRLTALGKLILTK